MAVKKNLRENGPRMLMSIVAIPIAFRVGKKLLPTATPSEQVAA